MPLTESPNTQDLLYFSSDDATTVNVVSPGNPLPVGFASGTATSVSAVAAAGITYVPGDTITLAGGGAFTPTVLTVTHTKVVSAVVHAGGTGGSPGPVTITGTTGTGTPFQATGTISAGGILTGALVVSVAGDYTVNPTSITAEPVTGGSLSGCTVTLVMGVLTVTLTTPGRYSITPTNPVAQDSTSGSGTGATFTMVYSDPTAFVLGGNQTYNTASNTAGYQVKTGPGVFRGFSVNTVGLTSSATFYDGTSTGGAKLGTFSTLAINSLQFNYAFTTGLFVVLAGGTPADVTVAYS